MAVEVDRQRLESGVGQAVETQVRQRDPREVRRQRGVVLRGGTPLTADGAKADAVEVARREAEEHGSGEIDRWGFGMSICRFGRTYVHVNLSSPVSVWWTMCGNCDGWRLHNACIQGWISHLGYQGRKSIIECISHLGYQGHT